MKNVWKFAQPEPFVLPDLSEMKIFPLSLLLLLCIGCTNQVQEKVVLLDKKLALTPILSASFDSLLQDVQQLPPKQKVDIWLRISSRNEEEPGGIEKQEHLLLQALPPASKKEEKRVLLQLIVLYSKLDDMGFPDANTKGIQRCEELEKNYFLSQEERWKTMEIKASLLNKQGQQEMYLPIWYKLLNEHRKADKPAFVVKDLYTIANHFSMLGDQKEGLSLYKEAYLIATENHLTALQTKCLVAIINLLYDLGRYTEVIDYNHNAGIDSIASLMPNIYTMQAICYQQLHKPDSAHIYLTKELISAGQGNITIHCLMAENYIAKNQEDSATFFLNKAMKLFQEQARHAQEKNIKVYLPRIFLPAYSLLGDLLQRKGKMQQANEAFMRVAPLMKEPARSQPQLAKQINALTRYSSFCRTTGELEKALDLLAWRDSIRQIHDTIIQKRDTKNLVERFKSQELIHTIDMQNVQLTDSNRLLVIISVFVLFLLFTLAGVIYLYHERRKQLSVIFNQSHELQTLRENIPTEKQEQPNQLEALFCTAQEKVTTKKLYLNKALTISQLATELNTNRSYLSSCINTCSGGNFNQWINNYRISYVLKRMHSTEMLPKLIEEAGFVSLDSFYRNFKRCTQLTPSQYLERHRENF